MKLSERTRKTIVAMCACVALVANYSSFTAIAVDLNSVGSNTSQTQTYDNSSDNSTYNDYTDEETFKILYGDTKISAEEAEKAAAIAAPAVKVIRTILAIILAILPIIMLLNSAVDIVCLSISPLRKAMVAAHGGGGAGGGMGGMGMGMGGMGMGGPSGGGQPQGLLQTIAQWASKEAVDAATEAGGGGAAGGGMGGMGMGMGMGMGGGGAAAPSTKNILVTYFKKRVVFLVAFGVCVIVFSCTAFTDLGLKIGAWIVEHVAGLSF